MIYKSLSLACLCALSILPSFASTANELEQKLDHLLQENSNFLPTAKNWYTFVKEDYSGSKVYTFEIMDTARAYLAVINKNYSLTPESYESKDINNLMEIIKTCDQYQEVAKQSSNFNKYTTDCFFFQTIFATSAYNYEALQTLALEALQDEYQELQAPSAEQRKIYQALLNYQNIKTSFTKYYLKPEDYGQHNLPLYFKKVFNLQLSLER
ncbi:hypothetical protein [Psittacicella gerlachiana]|uniref:Uncharacterized protein n=1 Tax=Psittacicella gerlachiana TaxID=2028574 RepID=A0A3A1Y5W9_9GAMM|nr:hypothetical protein [Psittacicella gerlachiana]RIY32676.1 hypothetical protein CKF59_06810 [Psittacicella gerlachiana]